MDKDTALEHVLMIARMICEPVTWEDPAELRDDLRRALDEYDRARGDELRQPSTPPLKEAP